MLTTNAASESGYVVEHSVKHSFPWSAHIIRTFASWSKSQQREPDSQEDRTRWREQTSSKVSLPCRYFSAAVVLHHRVILCIIPWCIGPAWFDLGPPLSRKLGSRYESSHSLPAGNWFFFFFFTKLDVNAVATPVASVSTMLCQSGAKTLQSQCRLNDLTRQI